MMACSGVRISCDMLLKNAFFIGFAAAGQFERILQQLELLELAGSFPH